ncbi:MAG: Rpn family recombination-promoting nuclease/putative transposase, partial [Wolbachia sp.]
WCFFFKHAENTTDKDLKDIAEKSPIIKLAYDALDKFSWEEDDLAAYEERVLNVQKEAAIWEQRLDDATEKGKKEGIQIGHQKGRAEGRKERDIEVAKNSLKAGVSIDVIAEITGLPVDEIKQLQEEIAQ